MTTATLETEIWRAQRKWLSSFEGLPPAVLYAGTGQGTPKETHLVVSSITAPPERLMIASGQPHARRGTLQIMFRCPLASFNAVVARQEASALAAHFVDGTKMRDGGVCLTVMEYPEVGDAFEDSGWWVTPVRVRWETMA